MANITGSDVGGGAISAIFVTIKLTIFAEATYHFAMVLFDAGLAGIAGLVVVHYGKKILPIFDAWVIKTFNRLFK